MAEEETRHTMDEEEASIKIQRAFRAHEARKHTGEVSASGSSSSAGGHQQPVAIMNVEEGDNPTEPITSTEIEGEPSVIENPETVIPDEVKEEPAPDSTGNEITEEQVPSAKAETYVVGDVASSAELLVDQTISTIVKLSTTDFNSSSENKASGVPSGPKPSKLSADVGSIFGEARRSSDLSIQQGKPSTAKNMSGIDTKGASESRESVIPAKPSVLPTLGRSIPIDDPKSSKASVTSGTSKKGSGQSKHSKPSQSGPEPTTRCGRKLKEVQAEEHQIRCSTTAKNTTCYPKEYYTDYPGEIVAVDEILSFYCTMVDTLGSENLPCNECDLEENLGGEDETMVGFISQIVTGLLETAADKWRVMRDRQVSKSKSSVMDAPTMTSDNEGVVGSVEAALLAPIQSELTTDENHDQSVIEMSVNSTQEVGTEGITPSESQATESSQTLQ